MPARQQAPVQAQRGHMKKKLGMITENTRRRLRIETLLDILPGNMRIEREQEVPAQEEKGIVEEIEARIGREAEETTMKVEEIIEETIVQAGEITAQIGKPGGTIVQDTGRGRVDPGVEETTHLKRAEGTLAKTDEVVAKGPLVMEGP